MQTCGRYVNSIGGSFLLGRRDADRCEISTSFRSICVGRSRGEFIDNGHLRYYASKIRMEEEGKRRKKNKKRNISKDVFDLMYITEKQRTVDEIGNKGMIEDLVLAQFEDIRIKDDQMMKMEKESSVSSSSSSSSSSDSGDSDYEDKMMKKRKKQEEKTIKKMMKKNKKNKKKNSVIFENMMMIKDSSDTCSNHAVSTITASPKIEVCMEGKCKKSGAMQLKAEFEKVVGSESVVDGCKCMGRCKEGPNIRILNHLNKEGIMNPLSISVGLEDVKIIAATYFGKN